ncbi:hypothetical protein PUN28_020125 [Cardiocondyla obscurior]|uniref:Protein-serine O-palmitoleoyltransferase porcupine n=1 Tax=Cardiocondyla obscurior TaxID=286306 RepID=A0AAW2E6M9_9HYME
MEDAGATVFYDDEDCLDYECLHSNAEYDYDYADSEKESLHELYQYCLTPSLYDTGHYILPLLGSTILFRLLIHTKYISHKAFHILSVSIGLYIIHHYVPESVIILIIFTLFSYGVLQVAKKWHIGVGIFLPSLLIIAYCEFFMHPVTWHKIRSVVMIMVMKAISIAIDTDDSNDLPDIYSFMGYMFCGITCLFGPWVSFRDYLSLRYFTGQTKWWITCWKGFIFLSLSFVYLSVSNCWIQWVGQFVENSGKWVMAYRDALSFRMSHYFVSYLASALLVLGGFSLSSSTIVKPLYIELPRSLVQVVIHWNNPMHYWLKTYIFRRSIRNMGKFGAVIITYLISSLLHGLNFQLAAVLLSLGFYTYVEFQLRSLLADTFDACIASKQCTRQKCAHKYNSHNCWWVFMTNLMFSGLAMFHLAYLGLMFDMSDLQETGYSYSHTINKWAELGFASHWVALATFCIYILIK